MSIVLKDGTVLPDLPEVFLSEYQYYAICSYDSVLEADGAHFAIFANSPIIYVPVGITALFEEPALISEQAGYVLLAFAPSETTEWEMASQSASSILTIYAPVENDDKFVWSNHDILTATSFEIASDFSSISVTTGEIYFPNSLVKPPFVLPDGTELPALPDGCFDGTPYGVIVSSDYQGNNGYALFSCHSGFAFFPIDVPGGYLSGMCDFVTAMGEYHHYECGQGLNMWEEVDTTTERIEFPVGTVTSGPLAGVTYWLNWSNCDIPKATGFDSDNNPVVSSEIARKSDVNYRITGGYMTSIANEARRLGGKTGGMLPAVTEETLRGVTGGEPELQEKTVTPTSAVQVVVPDEGYDGLSKVTVEAVSGGGGGLAPNERVYQVGKATATISENDISWTTTATSSVS